MLVLFTAKTDTDPEVKSLRISGGYLQASHLESTSRIPGQSVWCVCVCVCVWYATWKWDGSFPE